MTRLRGSWAALAAASLFLLSACARPGDQAGGPVPGSDSASAEPPTGGSDTLVVRVERVGGFVTPQAQIGRLPVISVYADGRVITQGPTTMQYPPGAWPNLQVQQVTPAAVDALVAKAGAAGIRSGVDLGRPGVMDAPTTRITAVVNGVKQTVDADALSEAQANDPKLTQAQRDARAKLAAFVTEVTALPAAAGTGTSQPYQPTVLAALSRPYEQPHDGLPTHPAPVTWAGPTLTGGCVTVSGKDLAAVVAAAHAAKSITPWASGGKQWFVVFRPLLPDETSCADVTAKGK